MCLLLARRVLVAGVAALAVGAGARAGETRLLLDRDLRPQRVELISIDALSVRYTDEFGVRRSAPLASIVAMLPVSNGTASAAGTRPASAWIELIDGQRFPGRLSPTSGEGEHVAWQHDRFGQMNFPLDRVSVVAFGEGALAGLEAARAASSTSDIVTLSNGDRLTGFLAAIGSTIDIETDDAGALQFDPERVVWVRLASRPDAADGLMVWLTDGGVVRVDDLRAPAEGLVELRLPSAASSVFELSEVRAALFDAGRVAPLAAVLPQSQAPVERRRLLEPMRLYADDGTQAGAPGVAPDLFLPGPMRVSWALPPQALRFSAMAEMPAGALPWGDCEIVVEVDSVEVHRQRINADAPMHEISVDARGVTLTVTVDPGPSGPINDTVVLRRPMLLLDRGVR